MKNKSIQYHLDIADKLARKKAESFARNELKRNPRLNEFVMAMGSYFFTDQRGNILHNYECNPLDNFIRKWDSQLKITGTPMRFTVNSKKVTEW